jgi:NAD(P)-dependent dehydrogenase (short-subunit alcohol dehydrogenase family)
VTRIEGTVALVTGGNRGLGEAQVPELPARGASRVYAAARDPGPVDAVDPTRQVKAGLAGAVAALYRQPAAS